MIRAIALLAMAAAPAQAHVPIRDATRDAGLPGLSCKRFDIVLDTHHGAGATRFSHGGITAPIRVGPDATVPSPSYVTLGHSDREILTLPGPNGALHTRHVLRGRQAHAFSGTGQCLPFG